jgi:hypothetical protein
LIASWRCWELRAASCSPAPVSGTASAAMIMCSCRRGLYAIGGLKPALLAAMIKLGRKMREQREAESAKHPRPEKGRGRSMFPDYSRGRERKGRGSS